MEGFMNEYKNECRTCRNERKKIRMNEEEVAGNERTREKWEWEESGNEKTVGTREKREQENVYT